MKAEDTWRKVAALVMMGLSCLAASWQPASAIEVAEAATKPPVSVNIFVSTRNDTCYDRGDVAAITRFANQERDRINAQGGIAGHKLDLRIWDDYRDQNRTTAQMREALADPDSVAMIGLSSSDRSKAVFEAAGKEIKQKNIPFLSAISVSSIFEDYPNVFTMRASQDDERLPVLAQFVRRSGFQRPAFVGMRDTLYSTSLADGLNRVMGAYIVADHRVATKDEKADPAEFPAVIADLKEKNPDIVFLAIGTERNGEFVKALKEAGVTPALMLTGRISSVPKEIAADYPAALYELVWDRLPGLYNARLMRRMAGQPPEDWVFLGDKIPAAPGWAKGECKERPASATSDPLSDDNLRAIGVGTQYADMLGIVAAAARNADRDADIKELRSHIIEQLKTTYAAGRGVFQGQFENWSFDPRTRSATRTPFLVQLAPGMGRTQLGPLQFARLKNENLRGIGTQYLDIDLIRVYSVDDNQKTFHAEFYLSMRDDGQDNSIDLIEFSNAVINPQTNDRQITVRTLANGEKSDAYPDGMKIYHVSGRFLFQPELQTYPFDTQRFSINIRPKRGDKPFIVQPPPIDLRDTAVDADGWEPKEQYVGYDEDFVTTIDAKTHQPSIVPFYKGSFVWIMSRETTDYFLRVVVPLLFIMAVAYLSIFIPLTHFEAIVTIQVTALLSAVALYLSLPAIDSDGTTLSDRIFLFAYLAVTVMIAISVLRINPYFEERPRALLGLTVTHVILVPILALAMAMYVQRASMGLG
jgi:Periplasmic binding protein